MCREQIDNWLGQVLDLVELPRDGGPDSSPAMRSAFANRLAAITLCTRMAVDPTVRRWVTELAAIEPAFREGRALDLARGAPKGQARELIADMLLEAARRGGPDSLLNLAPVSAFLDGEPDPRQPQRRVQVRVLESKTETADRIVRRLVAYPDGIPATDSEQRAEQRLLREAASSTPFGRGGIVTPVQRRRLDSAA